ncbi:glucose-6-phosphate dehydrogenase (NADP(+)) [Candidatus Peregrinibacteria bacterium]|nr:glucose-6-phosphate dehydrogenase (NADP(+)) [Candidatus Peregrinibacteria bacterium]MBI3816590.1 glucose-6-phosphate dehydrogenase (NADP(+)) [Candidatus Peregrinibacteria bacterium]
MLSTTSPFSFLLFGASGNLAKLKLYPALYTLALKKRLPEHYAVIGFARSEMDEASFRVLVAESIKTDMLEVNQKKLDDFLGHVHYHQGQYDQVKDFENLHQKLNALEKDWGISVRLAYLSVPPDVMHDALKNLCASGVHEHEGNFRVLVEKPIGHNLASFETIHQQLTSCLGIDEIFLLDHYLGKEAVRNTYYLRFANPLLERLFKNTLIQHVEITALESHGIQERAGYFEHTGTFRDMFQSHLLMMASLLTMQIKDTDDLLQESRIGALKQFYLPPAADLNEIALQGQYAAGTIGKEEVPGYLQEKGVDPRSRTNTYAALKLLSRESRWQGVPFYLRSGKRLAKKETRISIQFQVPRPVGEDSNPNRLDIILQGEAGMRIVLQTKLGGTEPKFRPLILEDPLVCVGDCLPEHGLLILEAIHGRQHWFLTFDEVRAAWRLIDPIQAHLEKESTPLSLYPAGTMGPKESDAWIGRDGIRWF